MARLVVIPFLPFQPWGRVTIPRVCSRSCLESGVGLDAAGVGADSRLSMEDSSMMLSRDARGLKCVRDRERGRRRLVCGGEESGDA